MAAILIVDDHAANREYLVTLLSYSGHRLLVASDGEEALRIVRTERPDLLVSDILMPTMDGYELVRQIRMDPAIAQTPVIFCTAHYHEREAQSLAASCGVSIVITKPVEPEAVLKAVDAALGAPAAAATPKTEVFDREHLRVLTDKLAQKADLLRAGNQRLNTLIELNLQLGSELDLQRLLQTFGRAAREIIGARHSITGVLDDGGTRFRWLFTSGMDAETAARLGSPEPHAGVLNTILFENRPVRLQNPSGDPQDLGFSESHPAVHAFLGVPIESPTRIYGYLGLIDKLGGDEFSPEDERLAAILAAQTGRIYQNGSLYADVLAHASDLEREMAARKQAEKELADRARFGTLVGEVGAFVTRRDTVPEMLRLCAESLVRHLDVAAACIWSMDSGRAFTLQASAGLCGPLPAVDLLAAECGPQISNDAGGDPWIFDKEWTAREGFTAFAAYPLMVDGRLAGVLAIFSRRSFSPEALDTIGLVVQEVALGIERKNAEQSLREREEHIRLLLDSTAEAIYGIDLQGLCTFANSACARLLGYSGASQFIGRNMHELIHHTRGDGTRYPVEQCCIYQASRQEEGIHRQDEVLWRADGSSFPAEYWSHPTWRDGKVVGSVVTFLDITERMRLEAEFRKAQQRLRYIVVSSPAVLFTLSIAENDIRAISWTSDNLFEIFGYPPSAALEESWWISCIHPDDLERVKAQARTELFTRGRTTVEYRFRHARGAYCWTRCEMRLTRDETGRESEVVGAWIDITERKLAEEEQSKLREQLQQAQKLESVGRLAGGVAHDFNNLLTVINGYSDLLLKKLSPADPIRQSISEIRTAGARAAALSGQLLLLSRKQIVQPQPVNLNHIVAEVEQMLRRVIGEGIQIESVLEPSLGLVLADPGQLHQVLMNLAVNARDAMPAGGTLLIETANLQLTRSYAEQHAGVEPGAYVQMKVSDTGVGMTKEVMSHLFEPFFTTKTVGEGTGLGLATVYGIVKQSGGTIWAYSELGEGTTFTIYLPRTDAVASPEIEPPREPSTLRGNETILVVEDQEQVRKMAVQILRDYGYRVIEVMNPGEALLQCERYAGPIHLMLTDVVMPGITGPELAARVKPIRPAMQCLFMSGYSEHAMVRHRKLELSGAYLQKPFSGESLAIAVREVLGAHRPGGTILVVDDEPGVRNLIRQILTGVGYEVLMAENGREAVRIIEGIAIDLMITDLAMAEQEGIETIRALRRNHPQLRIIAMSGVFSSMLRAAGFFGAQASLKKPIERDELLRVVHHTMLGNP